MQILFLLLIIPLFQRKITIDGWYYSYALSMHVYLSVFGVVGVDCEVSMAVLQSLFASLWFP